MKKLLSLALALCLVLSLSLTAFAQDDDGSGNTGSGEGSTTQTTYTDMSTVNITKVYKLIGAGSSPAETFKVTCTDAEVTDGDGTAAATDITISPVAFAKGDATTAGKEGTFVITLPTYTKTGVYEYTLQETAGTTAGVTYRTDTMKLVVTVIEQDGIVRVGYVHCEDEDAEEKSNSFSDNTYTANSLSVSKTVSGKLGDKTKEFSFTVTFAAPAGKTWKNEITIATGSGATDLTWNGDVATFTLSDGDTVTFENVPEGVTYKVEEADYTGAGYTTTGEVTEATAMTSVPATVTVNNDKDGTVDTGINLDSLPYIMILVVVAAAAVAFLVSKRRRFE